VIVVEKLPLPIRPAMGDAGAEPHQHRILDPMPLIPGYDTGNPAHGGGG
jgi:hypothetical protein